MSKKSCGAIFYTFDPDGNLGIVLGDESRARDDGWLPFKGGCREDETIEQAAIREIYEETCGLVIVDTIELNHKFSTKRKEYHIGLIEVPYDLIDRFELARKSEFREDFLEKKKLKFFRYPDVLKEPGIHNISKSSVLFYKDKLDALASNVKLDNLGRRARCLGISHENAETIKSKTAGSTSPDLSPNDLCEPFESIRLSPPRLPRGTLLSRPKKFNMSHTPRAEKIIEQTRVWRNLDTGPVKS